MSVLSRPDVLVLGVGGVLGEAWMSGYLAGASASTGIDFRDIGCFVGTSAGSIVAARLVAGLPLEPPGGSGSTAVSGPSVGAEGLPRPRRSRVTRGVGLPAAAALRVGSPAGALVRSVLLGRVPEGRIALEALRARIARWGARFDGRLLVAAVDRRDGRRVVFGSPGGPAAGVADAVAASCAVPGVFRPVRIGLREYVDGGVWSPTNLDIAPVSAGSRVLCLVPTAALEAAPALLFRGLARWWRAATAIEAAAARGAGAQVTIVEPDGLAAATMAGDLMDPGPREQVAAAGFAQGLAAAGGSDRD